MSARCSRVSASSAWSGTNAMPMLSSTFSATPSSAIGRSISACAAAATASASATTAARQRLQDRVLVVAEAGQQRVGAQPGLQASRDLAQDLVAGAVPERVVDLLEGVDVEQQHRDGAGGGAAGAQRLRGALAKERAVGQAGELVVACEAIVLLGLPAQPARGRGDDPEEDRPQQREAEEHEQRDRALVGGDRGGDRAVAQVDLKSARRRAGGRKRSGTYTSTRRPSPTSLAVSVLQARCERPRPGRARRRARRAGRRRRRCSDCVRSERGRRSRRCTPRLFQILMRARSLCTERARSCSSSSRMPCALSPSRRSRGESRGWIPRRAMSCADSPASASVRVTICRSSTRARTNPSTTIGIRLSSATWPVRLRCIRPRGMGAIRQLAIRAEVWSVCAQPVVTARRAPRTPARRPRPLRPPGPRTATRARAPCRAGSRA